jgi:uncharacterized protein
MEPKTTLVLGASDNAARYSYLALQQLMAKGHPVKAIGRKKTKALGIDIETDEIKWNDIDTITVYLNPNNQRQYYDYILSLSPKRIIFNPGAENPELAKMAAARGIKTLEACTLVMLSTGQY